MSSGRALVGERKHRRGRRMTREKRNEMECEEGRKIETNSEVDRDRDRLSKGVEGESEKNAKMHGNPAGGYSTRTKRAARGWICTVAEREVSKEEQRCEKRAEDAPIRG